MCNVYACNFGLMFEGSVSCNMLDDLEKFMTSLTHSVTHSLLYIIVMGDSAKK